MLQNVTGFSSDSPFTILPVSWFRPPHPWHVSSQEEEKEWEAAWQSRLEGAAHSCLKNWLGNNKQNKTIKNQ
jgi:hypothetical protein